MPLVVLGMLLTAVGAGAWYINSQFDTLNDVSTPPPVITGDQLGGDQNITIDTDAARKSVEQAEESNSELVDAPQGSVAILVMGVDARPGEPIDVQVRADSLSVVFLDDETNSCRMLSIPRDTRVELPGYGYTKINSALAVGGVPYQQMVVENLLGIDIDHFGLIDFAGVTQLVDAVGGVTVVNDEAFTTRGGMKIASGKLTLNGVAALEYARYRDGPDGDYGRQKRQQQVVRALLSEGANLDVVTAIPRFLGVVEGHIRTDMGLSDMIGMAQQFRSGCTADTLETSHLEGWIELGWDDIMEEDLSFVFLEDDEIEQKIAWLRGDEV